MGAKPGKEVVRAEGGGEGTEAAANSIAGGARTKPVAASVFPTKRKPVKTMMWDSMVQATVSAAALSPPPPLTTTTTASNSS
ncbi:hypothetical protein RHGRI_003861 [Rhododendron griersonianum]|uniref:Uncharacterized protein n=1 Tax=Rhododendron griersonianum TaxID=479676 RepID=A0AAV6L7D1_9ERIC|nr:hypothetical protein RHGRI_003861 [Rhododendron griersonianum]